MKLKVKVTILKKKYTPSSIVQSLEIFLNNQTKIMLPLHLQQSISSHKFRYSSERIVRTLNLHRKEIGVISNQDYYNASIQIYWEWEEIEKEFEIGSSDLFKVRFSEEQRRIV